MKHEPVLLQQVISNLQLKPGMNVVDCTLGDGGHARAILEKLGKKGKLLGIDADVEAVLRAKRFLYEFEDRFIAVRDNFVNLKKIVHGQDFGQVNAILMDLGWSSQQFSERDRGFSFQNQDEVLDMRYDVNSEKTAQSVLNNYSNEDLSNVLRRYGEEKFYQDIADNIVIHRKKQTIEKVGQLVEIILQVYREKLNTDKDIPYLGHIHPATKVFQALRIEVNDELEALRQALPQALDILAPEGRLAVISFHSLEDRIVKRFFQKQKDAKIITKKPITASFQEVKKNPRSRSAKLRILQV
ncbi:MAG: 16S rRNA (cytosine(1402)-N(4))-methyltransferase RsmH [bacterium]